MHIDPIKQAKADQKHLEEVRQVIDSLIESNAALSAEFMRRYQITEDDSLLNLSKEFSSVIHILREAQQKAGKQSDLHKLIEKRIPNEPSLGYRISRVLASLFNLRTRSKPMNTMAIYPHQTEM